MGKCQVFMLSLCRQTDRRTEGHTDRQTMVKQYAPYLSIRGHKNVLFGKELTDETFDWSKWEE